MQGAFPALRVGVKGCGWVCVCGGGGGGSGVVDLTAEKLLPPSDAI